MNRRGFYIARDADGTNDLLLFTRKPKFIQKTKAFCADEGGFLKLNPGSYREVKPGMCMFTPVTLEPINK